MTAPVRRALVREMIDRGTAGNATAATKPGDVKYYNDFRELLERKDVPVPVIVTEYVEIARAFFEDEEPKLVNAVLDRIAKQVRGPAKK